MDTIKIRVFLTGSTGMVGEGVLHECLLSPQVESVLVINRRSCGLQHPKLQEIIHDDFFNLSAFHKELESCNACFFCLGISSVGVKQEDYYQTTYTLTLSIAEFLSRVNKHITFCYVSGTGTNANGRANWAKVKGKTESDLMSIPFKQVFCYRPGVFKAIPGFKNTLPMYRFINWFFPIGRFLYPTGFCTFQELGKSMIHVTKNGYLRQVLEGTDIIRTGKH